jgi:hypothetical protein
MSNESVSIEILDWNKLLSDKRIKRALWFKFPNDFIFRPEYNDLTYEELGLYAVICSYASMVNEPVVLVTNSPCDLITKKIPFKVLKSLIKKLDGRIVKIHLGQSQDRREEIRLEENKCCFDFEPIYQAYPKRKGSQAKAEGMNQLKKTIKTQEQYDNLKRAVEIYHQLCTEKKDVGTEFVMQFKRFCKPTTWQSILDEAHDQQLVMQSEEDLWIYPDKSTP